jgi:glycosyltransferase involved in cell wall biosynthesis
MAETGRVVPTQFLSSSDFRTMPIKSESFKPWYVWPNPAFHFRLWYESPNCRIFLIENITHNWEWLSKCIDRIRPTDYFFVQLGWHFHYYFVQHTAACVEALGLRKDQFRIMFPDIPTMTYFAAEGFQGRLVNHNCFLDYNLIKPLEEDKLYDAIYTARFAPFKRHELASQVSNLALVAGSAWGIENQSIPPHLYLNDAPLDLTGVLQKVCQSRVGLILSEAEGACYSSSEYLLAGIPVVSTPSYGGRDVWYNEMNSIIASPTPQEVAKAVLDLISKRSNSGLIRSLHITQSDIMRKRFIEMHDEICALCGDQRLDTNKYFAQNFSHKLLSSQSPDFESLFPC